MYWNAAEKKGYSGVAFFTKRKPFNVLYGIGKSEHDNEGRVLTLEFEEFFATVVYTPNSKDDLSRLEYRQKWDGDFLTFIQNLEKTKPVIFGGDLNVAHTEMDLTNPKQNRGKHGFTDEERGGFSNFLKAGLIDSFRYRYPEKTEAYSWWSYFARARERNIGWRIDYTIISQSLAPKLKEAFIHPEITGSDHCPVGVEIDL